MNKLNEDWLVGKKKKDFIHLIKWVPRAYEETRKKTILNGRVFIIFISNINH